MTQKTSDSGPDPLSHPGVAQAAADTVRKAYAVGLVDQSPDFAELTYPAIRRVVLRVREAGVAERAAERIARVDLSDFEAIAGSLREIDALLDESPLPATEWLRVIDVLGRDLTARLLRIGISSVARYERGERETPDEVAARLHAVALVIGDLAGAYNQIGVRRWFDRKRDALDGRAPADLLKRGWQPEDEGPRRVRELARALVASPVA